MGTGISSRLPQCREKIAEYSTAYQMRKLLFSATISEQVFDEISLLMPGIVAVEGIDKNYNPVRDHIQMTFRSGVERDQKLTEVANSLKTAGFNPELSRAIIFVKSRKKAEECALTMPDTLREVFGEACTFAEKIGAFHAGMDAEDRKDAYEKYKTGEIAILFATKAFGMGMDIPNIHYIIHYSPPGTFEDFLQEVGRAGRNEKLREKAGFDSKDNPIQTVCLIAGDDFARLKDQLHAGRISWHEIEEVKELLERYIAKFKSLTTETDIPVAVPLNLYSAESGKVDNELDTKFRIALYWLERLKRIRLGYFTITHLEFDASSLVDLKERLRKCPDEKSMKACQAIIELMPEPDEKSRVIQLSIAALRSVSKLSLRSLFAALLKNHSAGVFKLLQNVGVEPTKLRSDEIDHCRKLRDRTKKYPALRIVFSFATKILDAVPLNDSRIFEGDELDEFLRESIAESLYSESLPWLEKADLAARTKEYEKYKHDILRKRSKHAFTLIRLLGKTKHETSMEKVPDSNRRVNIIQSVFNGYHKKEEWVGEIKQLEENCIDLLDYVAKKILWPSPEEIQLARSDLRIEIEGEYQLPVRSVFYPLRSGV
ncbi:MAG: hypothetical protein LUF04_07995 [Bacteroides sp.]|nr:hypothetical protein [Bacteroides sp.]